MDGCWRTRVPAHLMVLAPARDGAGPSAAAEASAS